MNISKKVLYISYDGMTDPLGQSQVIPYLEGLAKYGYKLTILSVEKKKRLATSGDEISRLLTSMGIEWQKMIFSTRPPLLSKVFDQWKLNTAALRLYRKKEFDFIHCRSYVAAAVGLKLFQRFGVPFLFDMRGFWVDERVDSGHWNIRNPFYRFLYKLYKKKEKQYLKKAAHIVSLTQKGKEELITNYSIAAEKISVIPCCVDLDHFDRNKIDNNQKQQLRKKLDLSEDKKILSYLGSLGGWYMEGEMMDFFQVLKIKIPETIFLFITNDGSERILKMASARGISAGDIRVQPASRSEVPLYLSISNWSIFFIKNVYSKKASSPTKQGEIMAMDIPVICNDIGDTGKIIGTTGAGVVIDQFDIESYSQATEQLLMLSLGLSPSGNIRQGALKYYDLNAGVLNYLRIYKKLHE